MRIAVIGMGCYYPGAENLQKLWENVLARRKQFRKIPDQRLPISQYYSEDRTAPDKTYGTKAALIDGYHFDWAKHNIPKAVFKSTDIAHWIALDTALAALADSGLTQEKIPTERTGVIVGNTLTGEMTRANLLRLRWPFVLKSLMAAGKQIGWAQSELKDLIEILEERYKSPFPAITEDSLAGGLSNTIAGRICNYLDLNGGGYTVDGACSSSLLAIATTMTHLSNHDIDLGISGGVDISLDPFELIGFAKAQALSSTGMYVYDKNAQGFIPGEGAGFVVLKRYEDALKDKDYVYAVINGWGVSSDGKGGLIAPSAKGQSLAIRRAYQKSAYDLKDIDFIEGHGTGTKVGDAVELTGISLALEDADNQEVRHLGVTSIKSIIGHTKAAAGVAGFIKAVLAVNQRVIHPTAGCSEPNPVFEETARHLYPVLKGQIRPQEDILRAGVTGAGFGGINCHITMASGDAPNQKLKPTLPIKSLLASHQASELFVFDAETRPELLQKIKVFQSKTQGISAAELTDIAFALTQSITNQAWRAGIVAGTLDELQSGIYKLLVAMEPSDADRPNFYKDTAARIFFGKHSTKPRIGFLFPGQGSQILNAAELVRSRFENINRLADGALNRLSADKRSTLLNSCYRPVDRVLNQQQLVKWEKEIAATKIAQPAICLASLLWADYLKEIGIVPDAVGGHSLGELSAFYAAGAFNQQDLIALAAHRGDIMATTAGETSGAMLGIGRDKVETQKLLQKTNLKKVTIANINTPSQTVVSGSKEEITQLAQYARKENIITKILPVSNAFHSPFMASAKQKLKDFIEQKINPQPTTIKLFSSVSGEELNEPINMGAYLADQMVSPVNFVAMIQSMASQCDFLIEVGPKDVLTKFVHAILAETHQIQAYPVEPAGGRDQSEALNLMVGTLFVSGQKILWHHFYHNRLIRPFVDTSNKSFIVNPCENLTANAPIAIKSRQPRSLKMKPENHQLNDLENYFEQRKYFILDVIKADLKAMFGQEPVQKLPIETETPHQAAFDKSAARLNPTENKPPALKRSSQTTVLETIAQFTGFDALQLKKEHKLLDDLNLDSIKSATLAAKIAQKLNFQKVIDPVQYANAAIGDLVTLFAKETHQAVEPPGALISSQRSVIDVISQFTGFSASKLSMDHKLLDDLNLDSIKSATLVAKIAQELNFQEVIDPVQYANATIGDLVTLFSSQEPPKNPPSVQTHQNNDPYWIRNFSETILETPLPSGQTAIDAASFVVMQNSDTRSICEGIQACFRSQGHQAVIDHVMGPQDDSLPQIGYHLVVPVYENVVVENNMTSFFNTLLSVTRHLDQAKSITFVQMGRLAYSSRSFAGTLHLENPALNIKVIEMASVDDGHAIGKTILKELTSLTSPISVAVYDEYQIRHEPLMQLSDVASYQQRNLDFNGSDVLLVTGGAKGITKECAFGFAARTCAKLALLGRSPADDETVVKTLTQAKEVGIRCQYYACDITQIETLRVCIDIITAEMGPITGIIHGAGLNHPKMVTELSSDEVYDEIAPKLIGAKNLTEIFDTIPLKIFAAFSSIIGITGMPGNAAYAFSNESLTNLLKNFKQAHPQTHILALAYSIWGETGMGVHMGSADFLASKGIMAIPTDAGVARFIKLMENQAESDEIVIAATLGHYLDTWRMQNNQPPRSHRFMETIHSNLPGLMLKARARLSLQKDDYLKDHQWRGSYMFPTVFGLEAMAQAVSQVTGQKSLLPVVLTDIALKRPIVVEDDNEKEIEITALVHERDSLDQELIVDAWITTEDSNYAIKHFSARFHLEGKPSQKETFAIPSRAPLPIDPKNDLYGWLLFQGEKFQRIEHLRQLTGQKTIFDTKCLPGEYVLGDPFCRDTLLHAVQLPIPKDLCLPVNIDQLVISAKAQKGTLTGQATIEAKTEDHYLATVLLCDPKGNMVEKLTGYKLKILEHHDDYPTAEALSNPTAFNAQIVAKDDYGFSGEQTLTGPQDQAVFAMRHPLSFKDSGNLGKGVYFSNYFMWMGKVRELPLKPVYRDLIPQFTSGQWGLVTNHSKIVYLDEATSHDIMETKTWIGPNTFNNKASFPLCYEWHKITPDGQRHLVAIGEQSTSWVEITGHGRVELRPTPDYLNDFFIRTKMLPQNGNAYNPSINNHAPLSSLDWGQEIYVAPAGPQILPVLQEITYQTTLEDANLVGNVYFANYPIWQGRTRDQFFYQMVPQFYNGLWQTGELFCVESRVDHLREAMPFDQVLVRMSLKGLYTKGIELWFEYYRKDHREQLEKLATGIHKSIWVKHDSAHRIIATDLPAAMIESLSHLIEYRPIPNSFKNTIYSEMRI